MSWQFSCIDNALNEPELDDYCECGRFIESLHSSMCGVCAMQAIQALRDRKPTTIGELEDKGKLPRA